MYYQKQLNGLSCHKELIITVDNVVKSPCKDCPFRKDSTLGWIQRMDEIVEDTIFGDSSFVCHKFNDKKPENQKQCAGRLILQGRANPNGSLSTRLLVIYDEFSYGKLGNQHLVFDDVESCLEHHTGE